MAQNGMNYSYSNTFKLRQIFDLTVTVEEDLATCCNL